MCVHVLGFDFSRVHFVVSTTFHSIMADARYGHTSIFNVFIFFSLFFNCGAHKLLQSNFSLLIHGAEIYGREFSSTFSIHLRCDKMYIYMVVGFFLVKSVFFFFRKIFAAIF